MNRGYEQEFDGGEIHKIFEGEEGIASIFVCKLRELMNKSNRAFYFQIKSVRP